jgi:hypothetical protein
MPAKLVGEYLGREVWVSGFSDLFDGLSSGDLSHAVVLLWLSCELTSETVILQLSELVSATPLALFVGGTSGELFFDALLHHLDSVAPLPQIMTRWSEDTLDECVAELFQATWPSENRMDLWTTYWLVGADDTGAQVVVAATESFIRSDAP